MERTKRPSPFSNEDPIQIQLAIEAFRSTGHLAINKTLMKTFGLLKAGVLSNYIEKYEYFRSRDPQRFNGWFYLKHSDVMSQLGIKETALIKIKKELLDQGIIRTKMDGVPAKEFIKINYVLLMKLVIQPFALDPLKSGGLDPLKSGGLIYKDTKYKDNYSSKIEKNGREEDFKIRSHQFEDFWSMWPASRRGSKGKALTSWIRLCGLPKNERPEWQRIRAAIIKQKKSDQWQDEQFIPLAVTWLNNKRWLDDPSQLKRFKFSENGKEEEPEFTPTGLSRIHEKERLEE